MIQTAAVRFLIVFGCAGVVLFALQVSRTEPKRTGWCDIKTTECFDRMALRLQMVD